LETERAPFRLAVSRAHTSPAIGLPSGRMGMGRPWWSRNDVCS
jgi:hypothetical protein